MLTKPTIAVERVRIESAKTSADVGDAVESEKVALGNR
jgi:hypothetical protein